MRMPHGSNDMSQACCVCASLLACGLLGMRGINGRECHLSSVKSVGSPSAGHVQQGQGTQ